MIPDALIAAHPLLTDPTEEGVNRYLDNLESVLIALSQRPLSPEQLARLARLVALAESIGRAAVGLP